METTPAYLLWFFLSIRSHSGEKDYLVKRFENKPIERVALEAHMLRELHHRNIIALPEETETMESPKPFAEHVDEGSVFRSGGTVQYAPTFIILPKGRYLFRELLVQGIGALLWTLAVAFLGGLAAVALGNLG